MYEEVSEMPLEPNERLGDFVIVREVGRGGMGTVYEAVQTSLNRRVALKTLPRDMADDEKAIARFRREAEAVAKLNQPGIVPIYCVAEERGIHFYVMELVHGRPMSDLLSETRHLVSSGGRVSSLRSSPARPGESSSSTEFRDLPTVVKPGESPSSSAGGPTQKKEEEELSAPVSLDLDYVRDACDIMAQVAEAVDHAHRRRVIHRDIKPQNVLINEEGQAKITDFGLARYEGDMSLTEVGKAVGTPLYMSPEQVAGGNMGLDKRTDIYSLGASLYEMLTLRPPFTGDSREAVYKQIMLDEPVRPGRLNPALPRDLETVMLKAIEKDPALRYQSAQELADDLHRFLNGEPIWAKPQGPVIRATKWVKRNRALATLAVAAVAAVLAVTAGLVSHHKLSCRREARRLLVAARTAREAGQLKRALRLCSQAIVLWPQSTDSQREAGRIEEQMARAEQARRMAEQKRRAEEKVERGKGIWESSSDLEDDIGQMRKAVNDLRAKIKGYDPPEKKEELWYFEAELDRLLAEREHSVSEAIAHLLGALLLDPQNAQAKECLADIYWHRLLAASAARHLTQVEHFSDLVAFYDDAKRYAARLQGDGTLEISTSPPGATVTMYTYVAQRPRLVLGHERSLGETPVASFTLPMGSYLLVMSKPGFAETRYPVHIDRIEDEQVHVVLYTPDEIGEGFLYVPAGEFIMGSATDGDPDDAIREASLPSFFIAKHELTCREYREFVSDLVKHAPNAAQAHLPRYRTRSAHYWKLVDGEFVLRSDVDAPMEGPEYPIHSISFYDAQAYCRWRSAKEGATYRLPTGAEACGRNSVGIPLSG